MSELTDAQKAIKANTIIKNLELGQKLSELDLKLNHLFQDLKIEVTKSVSKNEIKELIIEIDKGTATNKNITRFLELATTLKL